jgi:hypothetical protein
MSPVRGCVLSTRLAQQCRDEQGGLLIFMDTQRLEVKLPHTNQWSSESMVSLMLANTFHLHPSLKGCAESVQGAKSSWRVKLQPCR